MNTNVKTCENLGLCTHRNMTELGAWVYSGLCEGQIFKKFNTIADAVKEAVNHVGAHVIYNGIDVVYGVISDGIVYYNCVNTGKTVIIDTTGD